MVILPTLEYSRSAEHRGFYGSIWLSEETLTNVLHDICNSIKSQARKIYITSFHANDIVFDDFINKLQDDCRDIEIIKLEMCSDQDLKEVEKLISGPHDDHAGNTEMSNMLAINEKLVDTPDENYLKENIEDPFGTDNLAEKSKTGIADNHPEWIIDKEMGKKILDIYVNRTIKNIKEK